MASTTEPTPNSGLSPADPFSTLHRMSTTAGVGLHDYVAVNNVAVVAIFAGIASALALAANTLLVVPIFAVICSIVAFVQISRSNGTQTGKLLAVGGLLLAIGFSGTVVVRLNQENKAFAESQREVGAVIASVEESFKTAAYTKSYDAFGPGFKSKVKPADYEGFLKLLEGLPEFGKVTSVKWNGKLEKIQPAESSGNDFARAVVQVRFEKGERDLPSDVMLVRRTVAAGGDGKWVIEGMTLFDSLTKPAQGPGSGPGGGGPG